MTDRRDDERPRLLNMNDPEVRQAVIDQNIDPLQVRIGRHFAREQEDRFCFNHTRAKWMEWTGLRWRFDETAIALDTMMTFTNRLRILEPQNRRSLGQLGFNKAALEVAAADRAMARASSDFDMDHYLVGTPTGYIDLRTGIHHEPDRAKMISLSTGVSPTDTANCPKWIEFLTWACHNDADLVRYLQKFFGYCLSGLMKEEIMTFIYGPGGNGKGVMLSVIGRVMGEYYCSTPSSTFMATRNQEHSTELARLQHRRLVSASETNEDDKWNMSRIKEITGNENPITARFMRQDFFEFWPVCKLLIIGNSKPSFDDVDPAIARRLRLVEFMQTPANVNRGLKEEFNGEFGGILRWIVDGFRMYDEEGLEPPEVVKRASQAYLGDQDVVQQFINDWLEFGNGFVLLNSDMGMAMGVWGKSNGITRKVPGARLQKRLTETYGNMIEHGDSVRYNNKRCFKGVRLNERAWTLISEEFRKNDKPMDDNDELRGIRLEY